MENKDLTFIKKHYGEEMAKLCRRLFPTLLDTPGLLSELIYKHVEPTKTFVEDLKRDWLGKDEAEVAFYNFITSFVEDKSLIPAVEENPDEDVFQFCARHGYKLEKCLTKEDVLKHMQFYAPGEELCTFNDPEGRLKTHYIYVLTVDGIENIKREDFPNPQREDKYSTSKLFIEFRKIDGAVMIISRYNHTVNNPNAVYGNNLDKIIKGLKIKFDKELGIETTKGNEFGEIAKRIVVDGKLYRSNMEQNGVFYCENGVIIDGHTGKINRLNKQQYVSFGPYIIDKKEKTIKLFQSSNRKFEEDAFTRSFGKIKMVTEKTTSKGRDVVVTTDKGDVVLGLNKNDELISYSNPFITELEDGFLSNYSAVPLENIDVPNVKFMGRNAFDAIYTYNDLTINFQSLEKSEERCFSYVHAANIKLNAPNWKTMGEGNFQMAYGLRDVDLPSLKTMGDGSLHESWDTEKFKADNLVRMGRGCVDSFKGTTLSLPKVKTIEPYSFTMARDLKEVYLPSATYIGDQAFGYVWRMDTLVAPKLSMVDDKEDFVKKCSNIKNLDCPLAAQILGRANTKNDSMALS